MPRIDITQLKTESTTNYPAPFNEQVQGRSRSRLGAGKDYPK